MKTIDSDAHVIETEDTWEYMTEAEQRFRPKLVVSGDETGQKYWLIERRAEPIVNVGKETPESAREMRDIGVRLKHMDELNVETQVLYPTIFITPLTRRPEVDVGLCRSYNRWMIDIWKQAESRLRWVVMPPLLSMPDALEEVRLGKENGACGVFMRGFEAERRITDAYFYPLYDEASRLDMPICVHSGNGSISVYDYHEGDSGFVKFKLAVVGAFHAAVYEGLVDRFPKLRMGFIEVSAQWVPYLVSDFRRRFQKSRFLGNRVSELKQDILRDYRLYVACQTDDDLPYILQYSGDDNILIGSDYGHNDTSSEIEALRNLQEQGDIDSASISKILWNNPKTFYGI